MAATPRRFADSSNLNFFFEALGSFLQVDRSRLRGRILSVYAVFRSNVPTTNAKNGFRPMFTGAFSSNKSVDIHPLLMINFEEL